MRKYLPAKVGRVRAMVERNGLPYDEVKGQFWRSRGGGQLKPVRGTVRHYLTPQEQWERTLELLCRSWLRGEWTWEWLGRRERQPETDLPVLGNPEGLPQLGMIGEAHRLFHQGDLVLVWYNNGMAERIPVWAVSSKGYAVHGLYLKFQSWWWGNPSQEQRTPVLPIPGEQNRLPDGSILMRREAGPLRFVEWPDDLVGLSPDHPAARHFDAEALRAGHAVPR